MRKIKNYVYDVIKKTNSLNKLVNKVNEVTCVADAIFYERLAKDELSKFEINITTFGYEYIVQGLILSLQNEMLLKDFQKGLYKVLAEKNKQPSNYSIKWSVEKCVKATVRYTDFEIIKSYFHVENAEKVTPKLFINVVAEKLKTRAEQELNA